MSNRETGSSSRNPFEKGAKVEVSFNEEGLRGCWYTATITRQLPKRPTSNLRIFVKYDTLTEPEDGKGAAKPLREHIDLILARPIPPREPRRSFRVDEDVDAFHDDGWWEGIVIAVLEENRYSVFFRRSHELIEFAESEIRLHREWVHGEWDPPLEYDANDDAPDPSQPPPPPPPPEEGPAPDSTT